MLRRRAVSATISRSFPRGANKKEESRMPSTSSPRPPNFKKSASNTCVRCFMTTGITRYAPKLTASQGLRDKAHTLSAIAAGTWNQGETNEPAPDVYENSAPGEQRIAHPQ